MWCLNIGTTHRYSCRSNSNKFKINSAKRNFTYLSAEARVTGNNRMDSERKVSQLFNNNPNGSRPKGRPKNRWWNCVNQILIKAELKNSERKGQEKESIGRDSLKRRRSVLDCSKR